MKRCEHINKNGEKIFRIKMQQECYSSLPIKNQFLLSVPFGIILPKSYPCINLSLVINKTLNKGASIVLLKPCPAIQEAPIHKHPAIDKVKIMTTASSQKPSIFSVILIIVLKSSNYQKPAKRKYHIIPIRLYRLCFQR